MQSENHKGRYYKHFSASRYLPPLRPDYLLQHQQTIFFPYATACVLHPYKISCKVLQVLCILGFAILHFLLTVITACHKTSMSNTRETKCHVLEYESSETLKHSIPFSFNNPRLSINVLETHISILDLAPNIIYVD